MKAKNHKFTNEEVDRELNEKKDPGTFTITFDENGHARMGDQYFHAEHYYNQFSESCNETGDQINTLYYFIQLVTGITYDTPQNENITITLTPEYVNKLLRELIKIYHIIELLRFREGIGC